jgi:hypothetical protein
MGVAGEEIYEMLGCDHRGVCRFTGPDDAGAKRVMGVLRLFATAANKRELLPAYIIFHGARRS